MKIDPDYYWTLALLGSSFFSKKDYPRAVDALKKAISI
jgi:hypothetical protein